MSSSLFALVLAVAPAPSAGEQLTLDPGVACLEHGRLAALVDGWLTNPPPSDVAIRVGPASDGTLGFRIHRDDELLRERTFSRLPDDCSDRHALVALSIAIALDSDVIAAVEAVPPPEAPTVAVAPPTASPAATATDRPPPAAAGRPPRSRVIPLLTVAGWSSTAVFWTSTFGGQIEVDLEPAPRIDVGVGFVAAGTPRRALGSGEATGLLLASTVHACVGSRRTPAALRACAGGVFGASRVVGSGFVEDRATTRGWAGLDAGLRFWYWPVERFGLAAQVGLIVPLTRIEARELGPSGEVLAARKTPPVGLAVALGGVFSLHRR